MAVDRNIWCSRISGGRPTKLRLYNSCILPIFLYGAETWAVIATAAKTFDGLDQWCLSRILISEHTLDRAHHQQRGPIKNPTTISVLKQSAPDAFASLVTSAELTPVRIILGHCTPVLLVCPSTGELLAGRDRFGYELSRTIYSTRLCLATAQRRAQNKTAWQTLVETATSLTSSG